MSNNKQNVKLYEVSSIVEEFPHRNATFKDVSIMWFNSEVKENPHNINYAELVKDFSEPTKEEHGCIYPMSYIDQLFTLEQATELKNYLDKFTRTKTTITQVEFPIDNNIMGVGSLAVGGSSDFYMLYNNKEYPLNFEVMGYYNMDAHERVTVEETE